MQTPSPALSNLIPPSSYSSTSKKLRPMPSRKSRLPRRTNAAPSGSALIAPSVLQEPPAPPQGAYPDYVGDDTSGTRWDTSLSLTSIRSDIQVLTLPLTVAGPLTQIADIVSATIDAVKLMRENKEECAHLVARVVRFLRSLIDNMSMSNVSTTDGTPTAANLYTLKWCVLYCYCTSSVLKYLSRL